MQAEAFFLPAATGARYCIHHPPRGGCRGSLLYVHPFAEEMNKSRRMVALAARAFAAQGWAVLQIDLQGCGDSSGEFAEASWESWLQDVSLGAQWLHGRYGRFDMLWGLRLGALLACEALPRIGHCDLLLWQPVLSGTQHLTQFLRLKAAAEMLSADAARGGTKALRQALNQGHSVEVAGYIVHPDLALRIDQAKLQWPSPYAEHTCWLEVSNAAPPGFSPASTQVIENGRQSGRPIYAESVPGFAFWQSVEIEEAPALIEASLKFLTEVHAV